MKNLGLFKKGKTGFGPAEVVGLKLAAVVECNGKSNGTKIGIPY